MTQHSSLSISGIELNVHLGWPDNERLAKQVVLVEIDIGYPTPPNACQTDALSDTFCYATLIAALHDFVHGKQFHLIEYLGYELYRLIKSSLPDKLTVIVRVIKHPPIADFSGQVRFSYGDN